jgi:RNA recognition motif-containing protein
MFDFKLSSTETIVAIAVAAVLIAVITFFLLTKRKKATIDDNSSELENQVYVGNLSYRVRERHLREYFADMGDIEHLRIIKDHGTGRSKGFGFITFKKTVGANKSLKLHGKDFEGRSLVVRIARPK